MDSNNDLKVNDNEVPQNTDNQSDNGLEMSEREESPSNSQTDPNDSLNITSTKCETMDESEVNDSLKEDKCCASDSRHQYSKEQLIQISKLSSARIRPKCLDNTFNNAHNGLWNPEKWISSRSSAPNPSIKYNYNKKVNDLKDRVIEEESDIILSPQRGSFGTGCHVSSNSFGSSRASNDSRSRDHYSERNKIDESNDSSHNRSNINTRRVGSGRIVAKERERPNEWVDRNYDRPYEHRESRDSRDNRDNRNDDFNDRRGGRYDRRPNRDLNSNRNTRYESHRYRDNRYSRDEEENEPEWFTEGPTSKHDTIELKGFDDDPDSSHNKDIEDKPKDIRNKDPEPNNTKQSTSEYNEKDSKDKEKELKKSEDFDVNAMFKTEDWYPTPDNKMISSSVGISENVNNENNINVKSRFKRWFNENPNQAMSSMNCESSDFSQMNDNSYKIKQKENQMTPSMGRPSNTQMSNTVSSGKIFEMLSNGSNRLSIQQLSHQKLDPTKAMSLADIESNLSKLDINNGANDDKRAFDRLLFDLNKKSAQTLNCVERNQIHNEMKNETTLMQTPDAHIVVPNSMRNAPSILELLKEQENKEALAHLHRSNRRVDPNQVVIPNHPNGINNMAQNSASNPMFSTHSVSNVGPNQMEVQNWQNNSALSKMVRPTRSPSNQEMSEHTSIILQKALQNRQPMGQMVRPSQSQGDAIRANTPPRSASNFLIPTSVLRNMQSEKDRDSVKTVMSFNDMTPESNSSQYKFLNENFISKPSPMRPIVKSNNPMGQSLGQSLSKQSPLSPHSDPMSFSGKNLGGIQTNLFQQNVQQNQSPVNSYQRHMNPQNTTVRPFNLGQSSLTRNSTPSPNALPVHNIAINSNQQILQMLNNPNVRTNLNHMQMMALQQNSPSDGRHSQYSQSRPLTASTVQQILVTQNSKSDPFNSFDRNMMCESESMKTSVPITYSQPRPQMQQMYQNSGPSQPNRNTDSRFFGQIFGQDALHHSLPELPTVPLHSALTLDDIERS